MKKITLIIILLLTFYIFKAESHAQYKNNLSGDQDQSFLNFAKNIGDVIKNLNKARFITVRKGWAHDYGFNKETGLLNSFEYLRSLMTFGELQKMLPMDIYISGPHSRNELNLTDEYNFGHYNPEFVRYFQDVITSLIKERSFVSSTRQMMLKYGLIDRLKRMQSIHKIIMQDKSEFFKFKKQYERMLKNKTWPKKSYEGYRSYLPKKIKNEKYWNWSESDYYFWIRRSIDGTMDLWIDVVDSILKAYEYDLKNDTAAFSRETRGQKEKQSSINEFIITNVKEFVTNIGPDRTLHLRKGRYNLSTISKINNSSMVYPKGTKYKATGYVIHDTKNLIIRCEKGAEIVTNNLSDYVLSFVKCKNITIENLFLGHVKKKSENDIDCSSGVLDFRSSENLKITGTTLYGCGESGLTLSDSKDLLFKNSVIRHCLLWAVISDNSRNLIFKNSVFRNNGSNFSSGDFFRFSDSKNVTIIGSTIKNNRDKNNYLFDVSDGSRNIVIKNTYIYNNQYKRLYYDPKNQIKLIDNKIRNNNE